MENREEHTAEDIVAAHSERQGIVENEEQRKEELARSERERDRHVAELKEHRDFRLKLREQRLTMIGLATTALIGLVGTITTLTVALVQMDSSSDQSRADFKREQQSTAYSQFLDASDGFDAAVKDVMSNMVGCQRNPDGRPAWDFKRLNDASRTVKNKGNVIAIVGSDDAVEQAAALQRTVEQIRADVYLRCEGNPPKRVPTMDELDTYGLKLDGAVATFKEAARKDLA